ncbi:MAG: hypothetical protein IH604_15895 [Burkholderiales bacterium]|nr:hypothetical protein [Burkholderiales bacterium]
MSNKMVRLVSTARHKYEGRMLYMGNPFSATRQDAEDLIALNFARPADQDEYRTRDLAATRPLQFQRRDVAAASRQKRKYKRKAG